MKTYTVEFWEKQSVWIRQRAEIKTDVEPTKENIEDMLNKCPVDYVQDDYAWETSQTEAYDFDTDFKVEESEE